MLTHKVLLLSARLRPGAIKHLLDATGASSVIVSRRLWGNVDEWLASHPLASDETAPLSRRADALSYLDLLQKSRDGLTGGCISYGRHYISDEDRNVLILHTSGSTGLPKAVPQSHRFLLSSAPFTSFQFDHSWTLQDEQRLAFWTLPLYHCYGLLAPMLSLSVGKPFAIPPPTFIPTASSTQEFMNLTHASALFVVPSLLEDMINLPQETGIEALKRLDYVKCGGGALAADAGDKLRALGVKLSIGFGSTEVGSLGLFRPPSLDDDWRFFSLRQDRHCYPQLLGDLSEPVDSRQYTLRIQIPGWEEEHVIGDTFLTSKADPGRDFRPFVRTDDIIVLSTGENVQPHVLESMLNRCKEVRAAIAFGVGWPSIGVLVEPAQEVLGRQSFVDTLWQTVVATQNKTEGPGRIWSKDHIVVLEPGQTLPRSDKGSILRNAAYEDFAKGIEGAYAASTTLCETSTFLLLLCQHETTEKRAAHLEALLFDYMTDELKVERAQLTADVDFVQDLQLDSRQLTQLHHFIVHGANPYAKKLPLDFVYTESSIRQLSAFLMRKDPTCVASAMEDALTLESLMKEVVLPFMPRPQTSDLQATVLLTGSTGSLGSHVLAHLISMPTVVRVVCLNREAHDAPSSRQFECNQIKGAPIAAEMRGKIEILAADLRRPCLGLSEETYKRLTESVTHVIHGAFQVNFLLMHNQFKNQYIVMSRMIEFSLSASSTILFVSSVAAVGRSLSASTTPDSTTMVPEMPFQDKWHMPSLGYGTAKLACEKMLEIASRDHGLSSIVVRCGQLSGALSNGYWNSKEIFPALFRASQKVGALPGMPGVSEDSVWRRSFAHSTIRLFHGCL